MNAIQSAEQSLRDGDPVMALQGLQELVRGSPGDAKLRIFLFQLLAVHGQWERALTQLGVVSELETSALAMVQMYGDALRCEAVRARVFAGLSAPMVFGHPEQWLATLIESLLMSCRGQAQEALQLRELAFEQAPASGGAIDGKPFGWIADADSRLGPVLEAIINGRYYWLPFSHLSEIVLDEPEDLRDVVWMPAHFRFSNGGESVGLIPTRYPGTESCGDGQLMLGRKTEWKEGGNGFLGLGQRMIITDQGELPLMDIRRITLDASAE
jgi:type VI secretion system protein ImpE